MYYHPDSIRDENGVGLPTEGGKADATLYIGDGYSIYILIDEWVYHSDTMSGLHADIWTNNLDGEEAELRIVKMDSSDLGEAQAWVLEQYPDYMLDKNKGDGINGPDLPYPNETLYLWSSFVMLGDSRYAVICPAVRTLAWRLRSMSATAIPFICPMKGGYRRQIRIWKNGT